MANNIIELMDDMHLSSRNLFLDYYDDISNYNISDASEIISSNPDIANQIITSDNMNLLIEKINALELKSKTDIDYFLDNLWEKFAILINNMNVRGEWQNNVQYYTNNLVYYNNKGYFCYSKTYPPIGTLPSDKDYWSEYDIQGLQGYGGIGNLNFLGNWNGSTDYKKYDAVVYQNKLWWAVADNVAYPPNLNHYPWNLIMVPDMTNKTAIQKVAPKNYNVGDFWFKITEGEDVIQKSWSVMASEITPRLASSSFVIGNNIYVVGGQNKAIMATNVNEVYDTKTNTWSQKAEYPILADAMFGFAANGIGYCAGGLNENSLPIDDVYYYTPSTNTWTKTTSLPERLASMTSTSIGNYGYCVSGITAIGGIGDKIYRFDTTSQEWAALTTIPVPRNSAVVEAIGTKLYIIGGSDISGNSFSETQIYDTSTNTWSEGKAMPTPRGFAGGFKDTRSIYIVGGLDERQYSVNTNEIYDTISNTWKSGTPMTYQRNSLCGECTSEKGYAIGGINLSKAEINGYVEEYNFMQENSTFEMLINTAISDNIISEDGNVIITENSNNIVTENASAGSGKTISIPTVSSGKYNYWIDWGDGTTSAQITTYNDTRATHTYSANGEYLIKLNGQLSVLQFSGTPIAMALEEIRKCKLTFETIDTMFKDCINLKYIVDDIFSYSPSVTSAKDTFFNCQNLKIIPSNLFSNNVNITDFSGVFQNSGLTNIPNGLFNSNTQAIYFNNSFNNCKLLNTIPQYLFRYNELVQQFNSTFANCNQLMNISDFLFMNNSRVTSYQDTFSGCTSLNNLPHNLFGTANANVFNFQGMFSECNNLSSIPASLFRYATIAGNYNYVFNNTNISVIPDYCFNGVLATNVEAFDVTKITKIGTYALNGLNLVAEGYFKNCTALVEIGENAFSKTDLNTNNLFNGCSNLKTLGNMDWTNNPSTNGTFAGCASLTNLSGFKDFKTQTEPTISVDFDLSDSPHLTKESLLNVRDSLVTMTATTTKRLSLASASLNLLSEVEKLSFINKYWTLTNYTPDVTSDVAAELVQYLYGSEGTQTYTSQEDTLYYYVTMTQSLDINQILGYYKVDKVSGIASVTENIPAQSSNERII